ARNEGVSQKRLAELIEIDPMSLVRILDRMETDGWVERRADPQDRRARSLVVTESARPIIDLIWQIAADTRAEALEGLADAERAQLLALLERVHVNLLALSPLGESERTTIAARRPASAA
ncbi:MAG TPA: MarR family transcriptional regulator, partial [Steroidobacteraceae bacterium]|nr:MarR family transcriptional regulator [Steroidobacteraceae bacterium]